MVIGFESDSYQERLEGVLEPYRSAIGSILIINHQPVMQLDVLRYRIL